EKALAAAARIEQYIRQIERQITSAALPQLDASDVEARRIEFLKALRQAPEITDIAEVDAAGREQIAVSRLGMDSLRSNKDRSQEPAFLNARRGQPFFSPVYFRKETEPYMTIGVRSGGDKGPVAIADVNLKFVWDVVSRIKIGENGKAYVVDANGFLVADPDIGLVLRKTNLSELPHVQAAKQRAASNDQLAMLSRDIGGTEVLASLAPIESLNWNVFVEQPVAEVYRKLNASISRTGVLLLGGLFLSALGAWALARGMVRPIRTLEEGAQRIGAGDLDQAIDIKTGDELESLADGFNRMSSRLKESYAGLERKVEERTRALQNSLDQQTAISEILRVISTSPGDVRPMLNAVADRALTLCDAAESAIFFVDGDLLRFAAGVGSMSIPDENATFPLNRQLVIGRAVIDRQTIHHADIVPLLDSEYPDARVNQQRYGFRALLAVPLMREDRAIGAIALWRKEPRDFTAKQLALVKTFADQAAIAIENVRLFNETKRALEQQTAIGEILRVISSSPTDVQPVLDAVAERAAHLCEANVGGVFLIDNDMLKPMANYSIGPETAPPVAAVPLTRASITGRAVLDRETVHHADAIPLIETEFPDARANQQKYGFRAILAVPLVRESGAYGGIFLYRREPKPFTEHQIALVETFARQAAIAIDNVRLFNETKEALDQQTAVAEILRVISSSTTDVQPVLDAIAERAAHLCDASSASMYLTEGDQLRHLASKGPAEAVSNLTAFPINRESISGRAILDRTTMHIADMLAVADEYPLSAEIAREYGHRTVVVIPLFREGNPFGTIVLRRLEVRPFSDREVELLRTFGDQAAIALENVRLFNETQEALSHQTATADILRVISGSPTNTQPVFNAIVDTAVKLLGCDRAVFVRVEGSTYVPSAVATPAGFENDRWPDPVPIDPAANFPSQAIVWKRTVHLPDWDVIELPARQKMIQAQTGARASLSVPLLRDEEPIGALMLFRNHAGGFTTTEIALAESFRDQAVIAIENTRLFNETKEALEQQRASGEVLTAISNSIADSKPVFDVILASCQRLFEGDIVGITLLREDGMLDVGANAGGQFEELKKIFPQPLSRDSASGIAILDRKVLAFADIESNDMPLRSRDGCRSIGTQSMAFAPMLFEGRGIGTLWIGRSFKGAFSEKQLTLLKTFADQAVIAIQNARLFNETKEALEQQRASGEVLAAISSSIADTKPVFDKILQSCEQLFAGKTVVINLIGEDGLLRLAAYHGPGREELEKIFPMPVDAETGSGAAILGRSVLHVPDIEHGENALPKARIGCGLIGVKAAIYAPLMWEEKGIGAIFVGRDYVGPFSDKDIAL
ncbi:MAG TPA: GAF domain-containing protein, partial [Casimicrobiaceae bacterium]